MGRKEDFLIIEVNSKEGDVLSVLEFAKYLKKDDLKIRIISGYTPETHKITQ